VSFEQALAVLGRLPESRDTREQAIDLRLALGSALGGLGEFGRGFDYVREAETLARALDDQRRLGRISVSMTQYFRTTGDYDNAIESGQRALAIAVALGDFPLQLQANIFLGQAYHAVGDYRQAIDLLRRNVVSLKGDLLYERFGMGALPSVLSRARLVWCLADLGGFTEGVTLGEEGLQIAEVVDEPFDRTTAYCAVGYLCLRKGDLGKAIPILERGLQLCQVAHIQLWFPRVASALGAAYALSGRIAAALPLLEQGVEQAASMGMMLGHALWLACLGEAYLSAGRREDALAHTERALALSRTHKARGDEAYVLQLLGKTAARHDPPEVEPAEAYYRQALTLAEELGMRPLQAHCHFGLGSLYAKISRWDAARGALSAAIELYRAMEMTFWLSQAQAAVAEVEGR
jgi:tetratricopeptide (TPR) repeat protein